MDQVLTTSVSYSCNKPGCYYCYLQLWSNTHSNTETFLKIMKLEYEYQHEVPELQQGI